MTEEKKKLDADIKKLVLWRIDNVPSNFKLSIGDQGTFDKEALKEHVKKEDSIGLEIVHMELKFIKDVASGKISKFLAE